MVKGNLAVFRDESEESDDDDDVEDRRALNPKSKPSPDKSKPLPERGQLTKQLSQAAIAAPEDLCEIPDDVYSMFFLSDYGGPAFWYGVYVTALKMALYTFLTVDAIDQPLPDDVEWKVLATQFLMLPIAVAIQEDLCSFFFTVSNVSYSNQIQSVFPGATSIKFYIANFFRGLDGFYSLLVNIVILLKANTVLGLFLNFAALQFLQTIDNM